MTPGILSSGVLVLVVTGKLQRLPMEGIATKSRDFR